MHVVNHDNAVNCYLFICGDLCVLRDVSKVVNIIGDPFATDHTILRS